MAGNVIEFTDANFESEVLKSEQPVLVDFWAEWCGPCKMLAPRIDALADEYAGKIRVGKLDTEQNQDTAIRYNISGLPTLLLFKGGEMVDKLVGVPKPEKLTASLKKLLGIE
jgi:thioredoxin 1